MVYTYLWFWIIFVAWMQLSVVAKISYLTLWSLIRAYVHGNRATLHIYLFILFIYLFIICFVGCSLRGRLGFICHCK